MNSSILVILAILPWIFVGLIYLYQHAFHLSYHHKLHTKLHQNRMNIQSPAIRTVQLQERVTKDVQKDIRQSNDIKRQVFIDWPLDSDDLSYLSYKSLESFLACCYISKMTIEVVILGQNTAHHYKIKHLLSKNTFTKYAKKGYDIKTEVFSTATSLYTSIHWIKEDENAPYLGREYFKQQLASCCSEQNTKKANNDKILSIAFWFYARLARLYSQGGEFYDLTWFHHKDLYNKNVKQGFYMINYCYDKTTLRLLPQTIYNQSLYDLSVLTSYKGYACTSSTIMVFPSPNNPVLECALKGYDKWSSRFHSCLNFTRGVVDYRPYEEGECIKKLIRRCFSQLRIRNDLLFSPLISSHTLPERLYLRTNISLLSREEAGKVTPNVPILWLGPESVSGQWNAPKPTSFFGKRIDKNNQKLIEYTQSQYNIESSNIPKLKNVSSCSPYTSFGQHPQRYDRQGSLSCTLSFTIPGFMKAGTTFLFDLLGKHPQVVLALRGFEFKETACYYNDLIQSDKSYERMNCFPFIEPHEATIFGDGTVYYVHRYDTMRFLKQENPNIKNIIVIRDPIERSRSHHRYVYSQFLMMGIPDMNQILDIAIQPESRLDKLYQLVRPALNEARLGQYDGENMQKYLEYAKKFHHPGPSPNITYERSANIFFSSIYFHPIYLWDQTMGKNNVFVLEAERISIFRSAERLLQFQSRSRNQGMRSYSMLRYSGFNMTKTAEEEISDVFKYLGLNPFNKLPRLFRHNSNANIPVEHTLSKENVARLKKFNEPFNELLKIYLYQRSSVFL